MKLSHMSLEELWKLFPIDLVKHNDSWKEWYLEEVERIKHILSKNSIKRISHIGSTAIPEIDAKNIVDILLEVKNELDLRHAKEMLTQNGYICMSETSTRISLNKGYTEQGYAEKVFHLHLRLDGDHDELYFRDYLLDHVKVAKEYEALKKSLVPAYVHNRDGYTKAKTAFITKITQQARKLYGHRTQELEEGITR